MKRFKRRKKTPKMELAYRRGVKPRSKVRDALALLSLFASLGAASYMLIFTQYFSLAGRFIGEIGNSRPSEEVEESRVSIVMVRNGEAFAIDSEGKLLSKISGEKEGIKVEDHRSEISYDEGNRVVPRTFEERVIALDKGLKELKLPASHFKILETPFEVRAATPGFEVVLDTKDPVEAELDVLKRALSYFSTNNISPKAYINVTVRDKVYWK